MAGAFDEPSCSRRDFVPSDFEFVKEFARHGVTIFDVGEVHAVLGTLGVRGGRRGERSAYCRGGGRAEKLAAGVVLVQYGCRFMVSAHFHSCKNIWATSNAGWTDAWPERR
eukprot:CAMPEP_0174717532 /NCGR_PEP_ID=MMETSP1094-20130205/26486_1 /TAXON_ID=156173 /ORGANISM="Chrysochromulina brevifilum, Strain UTEX LB 985" /LENGTH=110 /DNA_ID=CAMNT_0015917469 /DNA_START=472 /DNA_END=804 /DNA_ORIENTATION=+